MSIELLIAFLALGTITGFLAGLLGLGGGGLLVPILSSIFIYQGFPNEQIMHFALGTSMACITITSFSSLRAHHKKQSIDWTLVKIMSIGMIIGTFIGTFFASMMSTRGLALFFSAFMAYISIQMFTNKPVTAYKEQTSNAQLLSVSFFIGGISALVSIGGGSLTVPYLTWRNIDIKKAIGTSAALGFPIAVSGSIGYLINGITISPEIPNSLGFIYLPALIAISITSYWTAPLGAKITHQLPVSKIKKIFSLLLILLSLKMLLSFY